MRERPCLLFACIFLTGIAFQRYEWKCLCSIPLMFLCVEIYHCIKSIKNTWKFASGECLEQRLNFNKTVCSYKVLKCFAGRSLVFLSAFFLGMSHMKSEEGFRDAYMSKLEDDSEAVVWGEIIKIEKTEYGSRLLLTDTYVSLSLGNLLENLMENLMEVNVPCNKVMVYASSDQYRIGQIYQFKGQLHFFEKARNEGNFDALVFYQSQKIDFFLYEKESVLLDSNENKIRDWILELKVRLEGVYKKAFSEDVIQDGDVREGVIQGSAVRGEDAWEGVIQGRVIRDEDAREGVVQSRVLQDEEAQEEMIQGGTVQENTIYGDAAGFYIGMLLGDKSLLSDRTKDLFAVGGISHILAISGLHMSMIGRGFYEWLRKRRLGFLMAGVSAGLVLVGYCYMVGSGTSAVRAVGMMLLYFLAQYVGRSYDMLNALGAVMIYLLWDNPFLLEYSGFQFSITALIGVGFVGMRLSEGVEEKNSSKEKDLIKEITLGTEKCTKKEDDSNTSKNYSGIVIIVFQKWWSNFVPGFWMSMGITLTTLPIAACCYYEVPLYSTFVNSLVLPMLTPIFVLALFGGLIGCVIPIAGNILLIPCGWLFAFYEWVCEFVERLPFSVVITGKPKMELVVFYYIVLFLGCVILKCLRSLRERKKMKEDVQTGEQWKGSFVLKLVILITCFFLVLYPKKSGAEMIFLDVGQGDGIFIASEDGITCFIDGGSSDVKEVGTYRILPFLKAHGVKQIDYWFVSHADSDHMSGLLEVMESGYEIAYLVVSDKMPEDENKEKLITLAEQQEISILQMKAGDIIQTMASSQGDMHVTGGIRITSLYPWEDAVDRNEQSLVLLLEFLDESGASIYKAIFSGDISAKGEAELRQQDVLKDVDLYKAAHHGSKYSNSEGFLQVIQPEICVISCGIDNSYGHPHDEVVERMHKAGAELFYTMYGGQIAVELGETVQIHVWLQESGV